MPPAGQNFLSGMISKNMGWNESVCYLSPMRFRAA